MSPDASTARVLFVPFLGIQQLAPGSTLGFGPDGELRTRRYWTYEPTIEPGEGSSDERDIEAFREELVRVVEMQVLASDVPVGACLSGGLDSSLIAALACTHKDGFTTFTSVSDGSLDPRFSYMLSRSHGLDSHFLRFDPAAVIDGLPLVAWSAEGVFDLAFASRLQLCSFARERGIVVLLSGQGIDELTGAYDETYACMVAAATRATAGPRALRVRCGGELDAGRSQALSRPPAGSAVGQAVPRARDDVRRAPARGHGGWHQASGC